MNNDPGMVNVDGLLIVAVNCNVQDLHGHRLGLTSF